MVLKHITNKKMKATNIYQTLKTKGYGTDGMKPQLPGVGSPLKKSPYKFNAGLKKAAAEGKLDNNPKFKDAVESSPAKLAPVVAAVGKKLLVGAAKKMIAKKAAEKLQKKQGSPAMMKDNPNKDNPKKKKALESKKAGPEGVSYVRTTAGKEYAKPTGMKGKFDPYARNSSPAKKKVDGKPKKEVKAQSITYDPVSGTTTRTFSDADVKKYNVKKQIVTKAKPKSPAKKKSCGSPVKMDVTGRKPNPRKNKARKGVTKKLMGLRNANRGCKPARRAYGG